MDRIDPGKMCIIDQRRSGSPGSGYRQGEDYACTDKRNRAQGKVSDDHQGDQGSS
jgi:hypothetical protein